MHDTLISLIPPPLWGNTAGKKTEGGVLKDFFDFLRAELDLLRRLPHMNAIFKKKCHCLLWKPFLDTNIFNAKIQHFPQDGKKLKTL